MRTGARGALALALSAASVVTMSASPVTAAGGRGGEAPVVVEIDLGIGAVVNGWPGVQWLPVVIFGSAAVPAADIDPESVTLDGRPVVRQNGAAWHRFEDVDGDGHDDLLVIGKVFNPPPVSYEGTIVASTGGGTDLVGTDEILVLLPHMQSGL